MVRFYGGGVSESDFRRLGAGVSGGSDSPVRNWLTWSGSSMSDPNLSSCLNGSLGNGSGDFLFDGLGRGSDLRDDFLEGLSLQDSRSLRERSRVDS